ncbi:MAG: GntR family transcriptional regulator [Betaproteobacteria bacterium]
MHISISYNNPVPLYKQIVDQIREKVLSGELAPGESLPSIRQLAEEVGTSVITTKRAYSELEAEGIIVTRAGLGSFVAHLDAERVKAIRMRSLRERLAEIVVDARGSGVTDEELMRLLREAME